MTLNAKITASTAIGAAVVCAVMMTSGVASATPLRGRQVEQVADGRVVRLDAGNATSIAGYGATLSQVTSVANWNASMQFTVPRVNCKPSVKSILFVELFYNGTDKSGNGLGSGGYVAATCNGSTASYSTNIGVGGGANGGVNGQAQAGDVIKVKFGSTTKFTHGSLTDVTTGVTTDQYGTGFAALGGVQASVQGGDAHSIFPAPRSKVQFSNVVAGGLPLGSQNPFQFTATDADGNVKLSTGPFSSDGKRFSVSYVANFSPDPAAA